MGKQEKIRGASVRAALIFRQIQKIKKDGLERITTELDSLLTDLAENKKLDNETAEILSNVYLSQKSETIEDRAIKVVESLKDEIRKNKNDGVSTVLLTLSNDGDLYKKPKEKYCYPMKKTGLRINIIRFLLDHKNYLVHAKDIGKILGKSEGSINFAISKINEISRRLLDLPEGKLNNLIISKDRGGYKLNPLYPITQE